MHIQGAKVSAKVAKAVASVAGGLAGSGIHSGSYVLQVKIQGKPIEPLGLVLSGIGGFFEGVGAAYLGAKLSQTKYIPPNKALGGFKVCKPYALK